MSHWLLTEKHEKLRNDVRQFVREDIVPYVEEWEKEGEFPRELFCRLGEAGFFGLKFPREYGGNGVDYVAETIFLEELAKCGSGGISFSITAHSELALLYVSEYGNEEQKQRFLVPGIRGDKVGCLGVSEANAGSDVAAMEAMATSDNNYYVLNGSKLFITNGAKADFACVAVKTQRNAGRHGISLIVVEKGTPGFSVSRKLDKVGLRVSDTTELIFTDCRVPKENLLGRENEGFYYIMRNFTWERIAIAAFSLGAAELVLEDTLEYVNQAQRNGRLPSASETVRCKLADMATAIEVARAITYYALMLFSQGISVSKEASMAKLLATEICCQVSDEALQLCGNDGYMSECPIQRYWRDNRFYPIGGGTSEVMKDIIARCLGIGKKRWER